MIDNQNQKISSQEKFKKFSHIEDELIVLLGKLHDIIVGKNEEKFQSSRKNFVSFYKIAIFVEEVFLGSLLQNGEVMPACIYFKTFSNNREAIDEFKDFLFNTCNSIMPFKEFVFFPQIFRKPAKENKFYIQNYDFQDKTLKDNLINFFRMRYTAKTNTNNTNNNININSNKCVSFYTMNFFRSLIIRGVQLKYESQYNQDKLYNAFKNEIYSAYRHAEMNIVPNELQWRTADEAKNNQTKLYK